MADRKKGTLSLPPVDQGMNKVAPNDKPIEGKGTDVGPDKPADRPDPKKDREIIERVVKRVNRAIAAESENRKAMVEDLKFLAGDQWPADVAAQRNTDKRPCLTINQLPTFLHQVTNPIREDRPAIKVSPSGGTGDANAAKMLRGWIRKIERDSKAEDAYDTAFFNAAANGLGYILLTTEWESETSFHQTPCIKRVRNPFTCYLDPDHQEPDGADARWGVITEIIPEDEFKRDYPKADLTPFDVAGQGEKYKNWVTKEGIRIALYYEVEQEARTLVRLSNGWVGWEDEMADLKGPRGSVVETRESVCRSIKCYKVTARDILDRYDWLGKWIPIIPVIGDEIDIEGKVKLSGVVRNAKDPQRMLNYWETMKTELIALAPKSPYIMEEGQMEGHEREWKQANTRSQPVLTYKGTSVAGTPAPPPQRVPFAEVPTGVVNASEMAIQHMMATTGIRFNAALQERMKDESGKAIIELQRKGDVGSLHLADNLAKSMMHLGNQLVDLAPKLLDAKRAMTIIGEDDKELTVEVDPLMGKAYDEVSDEKGKKRRWNPKTGEYGVTVYIGPSYATKRQESAASMMDFVKAMPQTAQLVVDLIAAEMDWPGAEKIAARLAKAVPPNLMTPDKKDVPPQIQAYIQNLEAQSKQLQQQLQLALKELQSKNADRSIAQDKIDKDFEAKVLAIVQKAEAAGEKLNTDRLKAGAEHLHAVAEHMHEVRMDHAHLALEADAQEHGQSMAEKEAAQPKAKKRDDA